MFKFLLIYLEGFNFIMTVYELFDNPSYINKMLPVRFHFAEKINIS